LANSIGSFFETLKKVIPVTDRFCPYMVLPTRRYQVWTVLHNFDCRASDGTTPAVRFFRREFPDLFESVLSQINALPLPRQRHQVLTISD
jgi:hypothetical protein